MTDQDIQEIRDFNRFYTGVLGLLDEHILESPYSLPEARVLYELHHRQPCMANDLVQAIAMDKGYLSRVLQVFRSRGILIRRKSKRDGRASVLSLTTKGEREFAAIDRASAKQLSRLLTSISAPNIRKLLSHMTEIKKLLTPKE